MIRTASAEEMLKLWGYDEIEHASSTARFFYENLSSGNALFWTIEHEGELIGELYVFFAIEEDKDFADGITTAYLCAFRVRKEYRGQGLGSQMMETALADLKSRGFQRATIGADDERNRKLYDRMGFDTMIKTCFDDPCARNENMEPESCEKGFWLLAKDL